MRYAGIIDCDFINGEGIGVTLFTQGCSHHCKGCQNPQTWDKNGGLEFTDKVFNDLFNKLDNPIIDHLTLSGGDPLDSLDLTLLVSTEFKKRYKNKKLWLYTGYIYEDIIKNNKYNKILNLVDILVDGEFQENKKNLKLKFRGSSNQRIIDVHKSLEQGKVITIE